ncbi:aldo/keto reductase [Nocardioides sp. KC13]|uniref:Aldo/keto reductase n=1 Tax=Nocardioides turkmenicus TaxID=2711220 RepID=A0A6M1R4D6_9ACTN|nr:aldo/keto reductase [Nocardioides sp. KC13]NGN94522.1 aldo/keto reductase [Nocardioides sp. KC13]
MQSRLLGATGLRVSSLALGTMTWGSVTDEHEAREQLAGFTEAGGTLVDTAAGYGDGASEKLLGSLLAEGVVAREDIVLATKGGITWRGGNRGVDTSRGGLLTGLDASLKRLGVDHVDLWQVHVWSPEVPIEETLSALDMALSSGRASYVGVSNYTGWQTAQAATWQRSVPGRATLASTQVEYSLLARDVEYEVLPAAEAMGMGLLAWSPLAGGVLTGKYRTGIPSNSRGADPTFSARVDAYDDERSRGIVTAVAKAAEGLEWTPLQVSLAWVRDRPGVTAPIMGARTAAQLKEALEVAELTLPPEIALALDDVSAV